MTRLHQEKERPRGTVFLDALVSESLIFDSGGEHLYTIGRAEENDKTSQSVPVLVKRFCGNALIARVACGNYYTGLDPFCTSSFRASESPFVVVSTNTGDVYSWGCGRYGPLGHGSEQDEPHPRRIDSLRGRFVVDVACRWAHSAVVTGA
jgi:alpha-tubulin suppressor-like RCC1 family protein